MNNFFKIVLTSLITLALTGGVVQAQDTPSPEEQEFVFRDSLFRVISYKASQLPAAKAQGDQAAFQEAAADIAYLSDMIVDGFQIEGNIPENSLALPSIWEDFGNFTEKAHDLRNAAQALADSGDMDSYDPRQFGGGNCGGCHRDHKQRAN
jgi:cytochrome c556